MRIESSVEAITGAGVEIAFRVRGFAMAPKVTRILMESADAKKFSVQFPAGFRDAGPDSGYASVEEFAGDYLQDHPDASPDRIRKAFAAEQGRISKESAGQCVFTGQLKLKWFGLTRLFIPLDVSQTGTIEFTFQYESRQSLLFYRAMSATGATLTLPNPQN